MQKRIYVAVAMLGLISACAHQKKSAEPAKKEEAPKQAMVDQNDDKGFKHYTCQVGKDLRTIRFDKRALDAKQNRCEIHYTKFGSESQVAWAQATPSICDRVYQQIRDNIESKGFSCKEADAPAQTAQLSQ